MVVTITDEGMLGVCRAVVKTATSLTSRSVDGSRKDEATGSLSPRLLLRFIFGVFGKRHSEAQRAEA